MREWASAWRTRARVSWRSLDVVEPEPEPELEPARLGPRHMTPSSSSTGRASARIEGEGPRSLGVAAAATLGPELAEPNQHRGHVQAPRRPTALEAVVGRRSHRGARGTGAASHSVAEHP